MEAVFWIVVGAMTGFVCSKLVYKDPEALMRDVLVGVLGALVGGFVYHRLGFTARDGLNPACIMIAVSGSVALLVLYRMVGTRKVSNA